jgi:hypothetical protein
MSEDMGDKIKQIADMLGQNSNTNIPDNVKGLLSMLMSGNESKEENSSDEASQKEESEDKSSRSSSSHKSNTKDEASESKHTNKSGTNDTNSDDTAEMARKIKRAANMLNTANDPKINLLNALRPYLNKTRQRKLQTCMKLIKMGSLSKLFDESEERQG